MKPAGLYQKIGVDQSPKSSKIQKFEAVSKLGTAFQTAEIRPHRFGGEGVLIGGQQQH